MARPRARTPQSTPAQYLLPRHALALLAGAGLAAAQSSSLPRIDYSALGTVAVVGSFAGLSFYDAENPPRPYDSRASTLVARDADGDLRNLGATDEGGAIRAVCQTPDALVYVGGNFSSIGGVEAANIASYDPAGGTFAALAGGLTGEVRALSCNGSTVYAGGEFGAPSGVDGGPNVAAWSAADSAWTTLPLYGFNGAVDSIASSEDGRSLFFGGAFSTTFSNSSAANSSSSSSSTGPEFPSLGSSLTPISLNSSDYWASPTTWTSGFGRPQYIFCPRHADGIGASWLLVDGQTGFFTARMFRQLNARGIRIGNTFYEGRGTRNFSVVSIPDNQVLELTYASNPYDSTSELATCSDNCPLAHDPAIPYQDFLFPEGTSLTGFQLNIFGWYGAGGGLHLLQLLSDGAYAYAVESNNNSPCSNGLAASTEAQVSTSGTWTTAEVNTAIPGTVQEVLVADVAGGTSASSAPSVTWKPYVSQPGEYAVFLVTPGCVGTESCASRTSVRVTATPSGGDATGTTVDQATPDDISTLVYNGTLNAGADALEVTMTLADGGAPTSGETYQLVANYVNLVAASTSGTSMRIDRGYGLYEYPLVDTGAFGDAVPTAQAQGVNASATMTNATALNALSFDLNEGAIVRSVISVGSGEDAHVFVGGEFTYSGDTGSSVNVVGYRRDQILIAPNGGLGGSVASLVAINGVLYAAGAFTAASDGAVGELSGLAKWNYSASASAWEALGSVPSVGGSVAQLAVVNPASDDDDASAAVIAAGAGGSGLAFYEPASSSWNESAAGLFLGNLTAVGSASSRANTNSTTYLAGNIIAAIKDAAPGGAVLSEGRNGRPQLDSFGFGFNTSSASSPVSASSNASSASARSKRSDSPGPLGSLLQRRTVSRLLLEPRAPQTTAAVNLTLPSPIQAVAASSASSSGSQTDQVLAGAFWKNGSTELMLLGGSFATESGVSNLGAYDTAADTLASLPGLEVVGAVTALKVVEDSLWVGGNFSTAAGRQGLSTYSLKDQTLDDSQPPLTGYSGSNATVNVIAQRPGYDDQILVAGAFSSAGSLSCQSVCLWDNKKLQWSSLATGLQGAVGAIDFAGDKSEYLIAAGAFEVNDETRYVARWSFKNSTWLNIGAASDLPGPATAVSADDHNADKIYVAGSSTSGSPYVLFWNGTTWADVNNNTLASGSGIQQLAFVPLSRSHESNDAMESNRMLLVSGDLTINDTSVSSALYDGEAWYPYLVATSETGSSGIVAQMFYSVSNFSLSAGRHLAAGLVILISIAIGLGLVFLFVLIGLLVMLATKRRDERQYPPRDPQREVGTTSDASSLHRPSSLLQTVGAATAVLLDPKGEKAIHRDMHGGDGTGSFDAAALSYGGGAGGSDLDEDEGGEPSTALARYSFHAEHPGELSISANEQLQILESQDPNWWMVANRDGQRGLVPLSYLA
ncbi:Rax2p [Rhodotorula paludigena]|uniref:Rax2p n=1 Tax=Rhodotorula paludigena TaxID=86838 RepID=UPI00317C3255